MEITDKAEKPEIVVNEVNTLMSLLTLDISFVARWTGYNPQYLGKILRGAEKLTGPVREALAAIKEKLLLMKEIMFAQAA